MTGGRPEASNCCRSHYFIQARGKFRSSESQSANAGWKPNLPAGTGLPTCRLAHLIQYRIYVWNWSYIRQGLVNIHSSLSASLTSPVHYNFISVPRYYVYSIYFMIYDLLSEVNPSINIIIDYNWKLISHVLDNVSYYLTSHHRRLCLILCDYPFPIFVIYIFWKNAWIWYAVIASSLLCVFVSWIYQ